MKIRHSLYALALAGASFVLPSTSQAALVYQLSEVGQDVVLSVSGSLNTLGALQPFPWDPNDPNAVPATAGISAQTAGQQSLQVVAGSGAFNGYIFAGSGPLSIGSGVEHLATSDSGGPFGFAVISQNGVIVITPVNYLSGTPVSSATSTFANETFSSLGVTAGSYVWTLVDPNNNNATVDTITLNVGSNSSVPEANSTVAGVGLALAGLGLIRRRVRGAARA